jgi:hypothetical protein
MGGGNSKPNPPARNPVPEGKIRICEAGFKVSTHTGRARRIIGAIAKKYPEKYESWFYFDSGDAYYGFLKEMFDPIPFPDHLKGHSSSPFIWLESGSDNKIDLIGGRCYLADWVKKTFPEDQELLALAAVDWTVGDAFHNGSDAPQSTADLTRRA